MAINQEKVNKLRDILEEKWDVDEIGDRAAFAEWLKEPSNRQTAYKALGESGWELDIDVDEWSKRLGYGDDEPAGENAGTVAGTAGVDAASGVSGNEALAQPRRQGGRPVQPQPGNYVEQGSQNMPTYEEMAMSGQQGQYGMGEHAGGTASTVARAPMKSDDEAPDGEGWGVNSPSYQRWLMQQRANGMMQSVQQQQGQWQQMGQQKSWGEQARREYGQQRFMEANQQGLEQASGRIAAERFNEKAVNMVGGSVKEAIDELWDEARANEAEAHSAGVPYASPTTGFSTHPSWGNKAMDTNVSAKTIVDRAMDKLDADQLNELIYEGKGKYYADMDDQEKAETDKMVREYLWQALGKEYQTDNAFSYIFGSMVTNNLFARLANAVSDRHELNKMAQERYGADWSDLMEQDEKTLNEIALRMYGKELDDLDADQQRRVNDYAGKHYDLKGIQLQQEYQSHNAAGMYQQGMGAYEAGLSGWSGIATKGAAGAYTMFADAVPFMISGGLAGYAAKGATGLMIGSAGRAVSGNVTRAVLMNGVANNFKTQIINTVISSGLTFGLYDAASAGVTGYASGNFSWGDTLWAGTKGFGKGALLGLMNNSIRWFGNKYTGKIAGKKGVAARVGTSVAGYGGEVAFFSALEQIEKNGFTTEDFDWASVGEQAVLIGLMKGKDHGGNVDEIIERWKNPIAKQTNSQLSKEDIDTLVELGYGRKSNSVENWVKSMYELKVDAQTGESKRGNLDGALLDKQVPAEIRRKLLFGYGVVSPESVAWSVSEPIETTNEAGNKSWIVTSYSENSEIIAMKSFANKSEAEAWAENAKHSQVKNHIAVLEQVVGARDKMMMQAMYELSQETGRPLKTLVKAYNLVQNGKGTAADQAIIEEAKRRANVLVEDQRKAIVDEARKEVSWDGRLEEILAKEPKEWTEEEREWAEDYRNALRKVNDETSVDPRVLMMNRITTEDGKIVQGVDAGGNAVYVSKGMAWKENGELDMEGTKSNAYGGAVLVYDQNGENPRWISAGDVRMWNQADANSVRSELMQTYDPNYGAQVGNVVAMRDRYRRADDVLVDEESQWKVMYVGEDGTVRLENTETGVERDTTADEIHAQWMTQQAEAARAHREEMMSKPITEEEQQRQGKASLGWAGGEETPKSAEAGTMPNTAVEAERPVQSYEQPSTAAQEEGLEPGALAREGAPLLFYHEKVDEDGARGTYLGPDMSRPGYHIVMDERGRTYRVPEEDLILDEAVAAEPAGNTAGTVAEGAGAPVAGADMPKNAKGKPDPVGDGVTAERAVEYLIGEVGMSSEDTLDYANGMVARAGKEIEKLIGKRPKAADYDDPVDFKAAESAWTAQGKAMREVENRWKAVASEVNRQIEAAKAEEQARKKAEAEAVAQERARILAEQQAAVEEQRRKDAEAVRERERKHAEFMAELERKRQEAELAEQQAAQEELTGDMLAEQAIAEENERRKAMSISRRLDAVGMVTDLSQPADEVMAAEAAYLDQTNGGMKITPESLRQELGSNFGKFGREGMLRLAASKEKGGRSIAEIADSIADNAGLDANGQPRLDANAVRSALIDCIREGSAQAIEDLERRVGIGVERPEDRPEYWTEERIAEYEAAQQQMSPVQQQIAEASQMVNTEPTEGQKEAGNYKKGHVRLDGMEISIEQPKGSVRRGVDAEGNEWENEMQHTYGYIRGTVGKDGDHIDVFLSDTPELGRVYVVDQVDPRTGEFDEHKVMYGFGSLEEAREAYLSNYEEGWQGLGAITEVNKTAFKVWLNSSMKKSKPFSFYKTVTAENAINEREIRTGGGYDPYQTHAFANGNEGLETLEGEVPFSRGNEPGTENATPEQKMATNTALTALEGTKIHVETVDDSMAAFAVAQTDPAERKKAETRLSELQKMDAVPTTGVAGLDAETLKGQYNAIGGTTKNGVYIDFFTSAFKKIYKEGGLFERIVPELKEIFDKSVYAFSEPDSYGGESRKDGTTHKDHPGFTFHNFIGKCVIDEKEYYVRFSVQEKPNSDSGTHSFFVTGVDLYNSPSLVSEFPVTSRALKTDKGEIADAKLINFFNFAKGNLEKVQFAAENSAENAGNVLFDRRFSDGNKAVELQDSKGKVYGWTQGGRIYLTKAGLNPNTPIHEYSHLWAESVKKNAPELWKNVKELMKQTNIWKEVLGDELYEEIHGDEDRMASEVLSRLSGRRGAERLNEISKKWMQEHEGASVDDVAAHFSIIARVKRAIDKVWNWVGKELFGIEKFGSAEEVADRTLYDLMNGTDLKLEEISDSQTEFSIRKKEEPKKKGIGYKVFYRNPKDGKLYPPMVANPGGADTPVGVWLDADAAPIVGQTKTGRNQVKAGGKGTQGGSGQLAYRPGWHLGEIPYALQFGRLNPETGKKDLFPKDFVWAEVEYAADNDYQEEAYKAGINANGKYQHSLAGLPYLPEDGYYRYRTNPNPETDPWIITGAMKVNRVLSNDEVDDLVRKAGREPQRREGAKPNTAVREGQAGMVEDSSNGWGVSEATLRAVDGDVNRHYDEETVELTADNMGEAIYDMNSKYVRNINDARNSAMSIVKRAEANGPILKDTSLQSYPGAGTSDMTRVRMNEVMGYDINRNPVTARMMYKEQWEQMEHPLEEQMAFYKRMALRTTNPAVKRMMLDEADYVKNRMELLKALAEGDEDAVERRGRWSIDARQNGEVRFREYEAEDQTRTDFSRENKDIRYNRTYHGSGADFEEFDHSFMGSGEGSQVYGWGTYVSEVEGIAKTYADIATAKKQKSSAPIVNWKGHKIDFSDANPLRMAFDLVEDSRTIAEARARAVRYKGMAEEPEMQQKWQAAYDILKQSTKADFKRASVKGNRKLYEVEIPDDNGENYLSWNEPLSARQRKKIANALYEECLKQEPEAFETANEKKMLRQQIDQEFADTELSGGNAYGNVISYLGTGQKGASKLLSEAGFVGVKVPTNNLRSGDKSKNNYVIFDEKDAKIVGKEKFREWDENNDGKVWKVGEKFVSLPSEFEGKTESAQEIFDRQRETMPKTAAWSQGMEEVKNNTNAMGLMGKEGSVKRELHRKAKAGDGDAADELVAMVANKAVGEQLKREHPNAVVVYPHAEEASGRNKLPESYAMWLQAMYGFEVNESVVQTDKPHHTGANRLNRFLVRARYDGDIEAGREYILVDDVYTMGGTLRDMKDYIESKGGKVVSISTLAFSRQGKRLGITAETKNELLKRGITNEQLKEIGIADNIDGLTELEAREIIALADSGRDRGSEEGFEGISGQKSRTLPENEGRRQAVRAEAEKTAQSLGKKINVCMSAKDIKDPGVRASIEKAEKEGRTPTRKGWFNTRTGEIEVYAPAAADVEDVKKTVLHETVGHYGLRELLSDNEHEYQRAMVEMYRLLNAEQKKQVTDSIQRRHWDVATAMDEFLADVAMQEHVPGWWQKAKSIVKNLLRKVGIDVELSDGDLKYMLWASREALKRSREVTEADGTKRRVYEPMNWMQKASDWSMRWHNDVLGLRTTWEAERKISANTPGTAAEGAQPSTAVREEIRNRDNENPDDPTTPGGGGGSSPTGGRELTTEQRLAMDAKKYNDDYNRIMQDKENIAKSNEIRTHFKQRMERLKGQKMTADEKNALKSDLIEKVQYELGWLVNNNPENAQKLNKIVNAISTRIDEISENAEMNDKRIYEIIKKTNWDITGEFREMLSTNLANHLRAFVRDRMSALTGERIGAHSINQIIRELDRAKTAKDLEPVLMDIKLTIQEAEVKAEVEAMLKALNTRTQSTTPKGIVKGVMVDATTNQVLQDIRGSFKQMITTTYDEQIAALNREKRALKAKYGISRVEDGNDEFKAEYMKLKEREMELKVKLAEAQNTNASKELDGLKTREEEILNDINKYAELGQEVPDRVLQEQIALPIRKQLAELRIIMNNMEECRAEMLEVRKDMIGKTGNEREAYKLKETSLSGEYDNYQRRVIYESQQIHEKLNDIISEGRSERAKKVMADNEYQVNVVRTGCDAMRKEQVKGPNDGRPNTGSKTGDRAMEVLKDMVEKAKRLKHDYNASLYSLDFLTKYLDENHHLGDGPLYDLLISGKDGAMQAYNTYNEGMASFNKAVSEKMHDIWKMDYEKVLEDSKERTDHQIFIRQMEKSEGVDEGAMIPVDTTKGEALYLWLTWRQNQGRVKLEASGYTEETIKDIEGMLGEKYLNFGRWVTDEFMPQMRAERYNPKYVEMFDTQMHRTNHYFPIKIWDKAVHEKGDIAEKNNSGQMAAAVNSSMISRTENRQPIDSAVNAFDMLINYGEKMEYTYAYARLAKNLNILFHSNGFRNLMIANHGEDMWKDWCDAAAVATQSYRPKDPDKVSKMFEPVIKWLAKSAIHFRYWTAFKQLASYPAFAAYSYDPKFRIELAGNIVRAFTGSPGSINKMLQNNITWAKEHLPSFRKRVDEGMLGFEGLESGSKIGRKIDKYGMWANKKMDAATVAAGSRAVYNLAYRRMKKTGASEEECVRVATTQAELCFNQSQQSSVPAMTSPMQKDRDMLSKSASLFQNSSISYRRNEIEGLHDILRANRALDHEMKRIDKLERDGEIPSEKIAEMRKEAKKRKSAALRRGFRKVYTFGIILPVIWGMASSPSLFFAQNDEDKEEDKRLWKATYDAVMGMFINGSVAGPFMTEFANTIYSVATSDDKKPLRMRFNAVPATNVLSEITEDIVNSIREDSNGALWWTLGNSYLKTQGINPETFINIGLGIEDAIKNGGLTGEDVMFILNVPNSQRKKIVERTSRDESLADYLKDVLHSEKSFDKDDLHQMLPSTKETTEKRVNAIVDQYVKVHVPGHAEAVKELVEPIKAVKEQYKEIKGIKTFNMRESKDGYAADLLTLSRAIDETFKDDVTMRNKLAAYLLSPAGHDEMKGKNGSTWKKSVMSAAKDERLKQELKEAVEANDGTEEAAKRIDKAAKELIALRKNVYDMLKRHDKEPE